MPIKVAMFSFNRIFKQKRIILFLLVLLFGWIGTDLSIPVKKNIRLFDPNEVARLDTEMWQSYYDRKPFVLFNQLAQLMRTQFGAPFFRSYVMAYQAASAAFVFKDGKNRDEYEKALPYLITFYAGIERMSIESFDVKQAARLELEWWIIHRQRNVYGREDLENALAETAAVIYKQPASVFKEHAILRAKAMHIRDTKAVDGSVTPHDWKVINRLLCRSWKSFEEAVRK